MINSHQKHHVIFDGDCGVCRRLVQLALAKDRNDRLRFSQYQTAQLDQLSPGLTRRMTSKSLYFIRHDGRTFRGARAVFETMKRLSGIYGFLGVVLSIPPISLILEPFYRLFAHYRSQISRLLKLQQCALEHSGTKQGSEDNA